MCVVSNSTPCCWLLLSRSEHTLTEKSADTQSNYNTCDDSREKLTTLFAWSLCRNVNEEGKTRRKERGKNRETVFPDFVVVVSFPLVPVYSTSFPNYLLPPFPSLGTQLLSLFSLFLLTALHFQSHRINHVQFSSGRQSEYESG